MLYWSHFGLQNRKVRVRISALLPKGYKVRFQRKYALVGDREINIFILDYDMKKNVEAYCDAHIVKMQLESVQLLCTAYWVDRVLGHKPKLTIDEQKLIKKIAYNLVEEQKLPYYKPISNMNHPCAIWVRESLENYKYLKELTYYMHDEWKIRYKHPATKLHKAVGVLNELPDPVNLPSSKLTDFAQAVLPKHKHKDAVTAYRNYYIDSKAKIAKWKTKPPIWWPKG